MKDLLSMNPAELKMFLAEQKEAEYRAEQIFSWLHRKGVRDFSRMTNISLGLRQKLNENAGVPGCDISEKHVSGDGTVKYLYRVFGGFIESAVMRHVYGTTVCVSSQLGCAMRCAFCASSQGGLIRNLTAGEMLSQVYEAEKDLGIKVSNAVIMGTGEPLGNFENVIRFMELIHDENGHNLSMRGITLSTCGLVPEIIRLAKKKLGINLAISLHAADDEKRSVLMPVNAAYPVRELISAADTYFSLTGRRITWEYMLISGFNDSNTDAKKLAGLLKGKNGHINIINYNETEPGSINGFKQSFALKRFTAELLKNGVNATCRKAMGAGAAGACGQLRSRSF